MQAKFVIFVVISTFLIAGIYSTSTSIVVAQEFNTSCQSEGKNQVRCVVDDEDTKTATSWLCEKNSAGTWSCVEIKPLKETSLPPGLQDALNKAVQEANTTGVNDTNIFDRLNDLSIMNEQSIDSNENGDEESIDSNDNGDENGDENGDGPTTNPEN